MDEEQHSERLQQEWQAFQLSMKHLAEAMERILEAWRADREALTTARNRIEALSAKRVIGE